MFIYGLIINGRKLQIDIFVQWNLANEDKLLMAMYTFASNFHFPSHLLFPQESKPYQVLIIRKTQGSFESILTDLIFVTVL